MTALTRYQKLESPGIWHESPKSQRRDVFVSLGEATLVIKDKADTALTHWSLPAVVRLGPGKDPAIFAPGLEDEERLELSDPDMIEALDQVRRVLTRGEPHRGRLRLMLLSGIVAAVVLLAVFWLPGALVNHTAQALPEATRQEVGRRLTGALAPYTGTVCRGTDGQAALDALQRRLFGAAPWDVRVVHSGQSVMALPGGILVAGGDLLVHQNGPDTIAGHLLVASLRAAQTDPMQWFLQNAGPWETFRMLTTGKINDQVFDQAARALALGQDTPPLTAAGVQARFAQAGLSTRSYGMTAAVTGEPWIEVIEGDPFPEGTPDPLIRDATWLRLQAICD